eukprot:TRINITY_DN12858_c0_g1_i1.p1 TRINITY_DN12858_c0_g1~~TRINITY_DN12858_c0_g1_i1.p1  ORF type:complete len:553 (-),score=149.87 TRINITY_DN12858_c0_g1_i1:33-1691(-)
MCIRDRYITTISYNMNLDCSNSSCPNKHSSSPLPFSCELCKTRSYCSQECQAQHWKQEHGRVCEAAFNDRIKQIEQHCPFLTDGVMLSQKETKGMLSTVNNILSNYTKTNVKGKNTAILGSGSYGQVFFMKHKSTNKPVAVKVIEKQNIKDPLLLRSLTQEIEVHKRLLHDNIIRLLEHCEDARNIYLVMEYAAKGSLFQFIRRNEKLNEKEAFYFFTQACNAVHFLHKHQLIHRDIKPENMLISGSGQLKLCDFGCCVSCDLSERKTFCGTIEYMAPEIIKRDGYKEKADIWSLGVLLYEMLHGYAPFQSNKDQETMRQIVEDKLEFGSSIKDDAKEIIEKMLHADPLRRPHVVELFGMNWIKRLQSEFNIKDRNVKQEETAEKPLEVQTDTKKEEALETQETQEEGKDVPLLADIGEPKDDTNASFTSDDYEQQRCESLMKLVYYLDDLDCEAEQEVLDNHVKGIENENKLLRKYIGHAMESKVKKENLVLNNCRENASQSLIETNSKNTLKISNSITPTCKTDKKLSKALMGENGKMSRDKLMSFGSAM